MSDYSLDDVLDGITNPPLYFDRRGEPVTLRRWSELQRDRRYRTVVVTASRGLLVSTVWLGIDHGMGLGPPIIFETMIFPDPTGPTLGDELYCARYATEAAAKIGHAIAVGLVDSLRAIVPDDVRDISPE